MKRLKDIRLAKGWTQRTLSQKSGLSLRTVQRIESGKSASFNSLKSLTNCLDIEMKILLQLRKMEKKMTHQITDQIHASESTLQNPPQTANKSKLLFLDNLRSFLIFLVILYHAGITYESSGIGAYFWIVDDPATNDIVGLINLVIDLFVMSLIFFISGYFTPKSVETKSAKVFIKAKAVRLLLPWAVATLTLIPFYKYIFLTSRGLPQESWVTYFHFSNGMFSQSWLWFLPVLFLFNIGYLLLTKLNFKAPDISVKTAIIMTSLASWVYGATIALMDAKGWFKTPFLDFQTERLGIYALMFLLGAFCFKKRVFQGELHKGKIFKIVNWCSSVPITLYIGILLYGIFNPEQYLLSESMDQIVKQLFFQISLFCLSYNLLIGFYKNFNTHGKISHILSRNSYSVYIIHVVVLGIIALGLMPLDMPSLVKYFILVISTYITCNILVSLYQKLKNHL